MPTATKPNRRTSGRALREWSASAPTGSPLRVDRAAKVIYGVRVLGRFSRNNHGLREATNGTEYTVPCMRESLPMYEGADVLSGHEVGKLKRANGGNNDALGVLRKARVEGDGDTACIRADLHYFDSHPMAARLLEDVERGLGVFGLSHDASAKRERFDRGSRRLVIESLAIVRSVDLVRKPATNRNLWESAQPMGTTLREMLDARRPKLSKVRRKWCDRLLEDDAMAAGLDAPTDASTEYTDPDDALWSGFVAAIQAIGESYKAGELSAKEAGKKVAEYLKSHESLTGSKEPADPPKEGKDDADDTGDSDPDKTEAVKTLEHKLAVRDLCEELGVRADKTLLEAAEALSMPAARKLLEREKSRGSGSGAPKGGGAPGGSKGGAPAKAPADAKEFANSIKG